MRRHEKRSIKARINSLRGSRCSQPVIGASVYITERLTECCWTEFGGVLSWRETELYSTQIPYYSSLPSAAAALVGEPTTAAPPILARICLPASESDRSTNRDAVSVFMIAAPSRTRITAGVTAP